MEDHEVLTTFQGLRLQLVRLEYADDDGDGIDCLMHAAAEGVTPDVEWLLRLPLHPDCTRAGDGATALMCASGNGHLEVAQMLCEAGADKDKADLEGFTAFLQASRSGHLEVVRLLCEAGADKDISDHDGATALILASGNGYLEVVRLLCEAGPTRISQTMMMPRL